MDIVRAFRYVFDDREWVAKLLTTAIVTLGAVLLTPLLIGFFLWAALLGYQVDLMRNWRTGAPNPLPRWSDFGGKLSQGGNVLAAFLVYNIPNILLSCVFGVAIPTVGSDTFTGAGLTLTIACCLLPLLLAYNAIIQPMLALALSRYGEFGLLNVFWEFGYLFGVARDNINLSGQFVIFWIVSVAVLGIIALVPCLGWVAAPALFVPVQGALMAQYAALALGKPKGRGKPKRG